MSLSRTSQDETGLLTPQHFEGIEIFYPEMHANIWNFYLFNTIGRDFLSYHYKIVCMCMAYQIGIRIIGEGIYCTLSKLSSPRPFHGGSHTADSTAIGR